MNLYIAGLFTANIARGSTAFGKLNEREQQGIDSIDYHLESYHYVKDKNTTERIRNSGIQVFIDSGAFSAYTQGVEIDLPSYCQWLQQNADLVKVEDGVFMASVLDGIGDPLKTWQNQRYMESLGVKPLPCFHWGEDERYLEYYLANYDYITIGGLVPVAKPQQRIWLDRIWDKYLVDGAGRPKIRVHAFGMTNPNLMERYPWWSVDSSSWVQISAHGNIFYDNKPLNCSSDSPLRKVHNQHLDTLPEIITSFIDSRIIADGYDPDRIRTITYSRWAYCADKYAEFGRNMDPHKTFIAHQQELFS